MHRLLAILLSLLPFFGVSSSTDLAAETDVATRDQVQQAGRSTCPFCATGSES